MDSRSRLHFLGLSEVLYTKRCNIIKFKTFCDIFKDLGTSLVVQWLRICLPMQGTQVQSLVREDPTCHRGTKLVHHDY